MSEIPIQKLLSGRISSKMAVFVERVQRAKQT